jgi:hypothetical protein
MTLLSTREKSRTYTGVGVDVLGKKNQNLLLNGKCGHDPQTKVQKQIQQERFVEPCWRERRERERREEKRRGERW